MLVIENAFLLGLQLKPEPSWVEGNLSAADSYNINVETKSLFGVSKVWAAQMQIGVQIIV